MCQAPTDPVSVDALMCRRASIVVTMITVFRISDLLARQAS